MIDNIGNGLLYAAGIGAQLYIGIKLIDYFTLLDT